MWLETLEALFGAPEALLEAPEALLEAPEAWLEAPEAWLEAPEAWLEAPEQGHLNSEIFKPSDTARRQMSFLTSR